jgi:hypothetical protein
MADTFPGLDAGSPRISFRTLLGGWEVPEGLQGEGDNESCTAAVPMQNNSSTIWADFVLC